MADSGEHSNEPLGLLKCWMFLDMKDNFISFYFSVLASLNLPAALEDMSGNSLPQSLVDKAVSVRSNGGIQELERMMRELPDLLQRNKDILDEVMLSVWQYMLTNLWFVISIFKHLFFRLPQHSSLIFPNSVTCCFSLDNTVTVLRKSFLCDDVVWNFASLVLNALIIPMYSRLKLLSLQFI